MQVQLEKIPQFLKAHGQFCNWKYELRDGNKTKVPYTPGTTRRANVSDPATFTAFETAASATGYDGIGIRVHGRIVGIDLDHCIEAGKLLPWAQTIVDRFGATYIEVSPSGTYTMKVMKKNHVTREYTVVVGSAPVVQDVKLCLKGDANGSGTVDIEDAMLVFYHVAKKSYLGGEGLAACDTNADGTVDIEDAMTVFYYVAKKIDKI